MPGRRLLHVAIAFGSAARAAHGSANVTPSRGLDPAAHRALNGRPACLGAFAHGSFLPVSKFLTPDEARAAADELDLQAAALRLIAAQIRADVAAGLLIERDRAIVRHKMQAPAPTKPVRQLGRPSEVKHPFRAHLKRIGWDVESWAKANGCSPSTVKAWMREPTDGGRKIPEARAFQIQNEAGADDKGTLYVPATAATWPSGIKS